MKTVGQIIKNARIESDLTLSQLADKTKIKSSFIELIENEKWDDLPPLPIVLGFVKSISSAIGVNENLATATLKRDYPPKKLRISPKPDVSSKFFWSPKLTFIFGISFILLIFFGYLGFQYYKFTAPPNLSVDSPTEGQIVSSDKVNVFGKADTDVKILVNNQPVLVGDDGGFSINLDVTTNTKEVDVVATSRSGKVAEIHRKIQVNQ